MTNEVKRQKQRLAHALLATLPPEDADSYHDVQGRTAERIVDVLCELIDALVEARVQIVMAEERAKHYREG